MLKVENGGSQMNPISILCTNFDNFTYSTYTQDKTYERSKKVLPAPWIEIFHGQIFSGVLCAGGTLIQKL